MEPESNLSENGNKRKCADSETEGIDPKRVLLESSVTSTTLSTEVSTSAAAAVVPDIQLPSSSQDAPEQSDILKPNLEELSSDSEKDIPTSSVSIAFEHKDNIESPSSSVTEDVSTKEISCSSTKEDSPMETNESEITESLVVLSSNAEEASLEVAVRKSVDEKESCNIENQVVSSSDQFTDVYKKDDAGTSSILVECEKDSSQVEDTSTNEVVKSENENITTDTDHAHLEDKLNISSTTEGDEDDEPKMVETPEQSCVTTDSANEVNSDLPCQASAQKSEELESTITDTEKEQVKSPCTQEISDVGSSIVTESKETLTFKGTFKNISHDSNTDADMELNLKEDSKSPVLNESQDEKVDSSFVPIPQSDSPPIALVNEPEAEQDKKSEVSAVEIDSTNHTPIEGSLVDTPCDSGETSPSTSTPADSCQVSAAPSPLLKEDTALLYDESSLDAKDLPEETEEDRELENIRPVRFGRRRKKKFVPRYRRGRGKSTPVLVDEETRMSATGTPDLGLDEDSQSSIGTSSKREPRRYRSEVVVPGSTDTFTADKVVEYMWPLEGLGEHYFIQEHISQYLGIISFKRRYPDLKRRPIESQEKEYLKDLGLVTEIACDLGLTAVRSEDMLDIMFTDYPTKYEELQRVLRERKEKQLKEKGKVDYQVMNLDKSKMQEYSRKASLNASKWNVAFNRDRFEERRFCFDLQTFTLHMPVGRAVKLPPSVTKMGSYPIAVLPGQYTDYCKRYTANELKGMPLQTVLAGPFTAEELATDMQEDSDDEGSAVASVGNCSEIKEEADVTPIVDPMSAEKQPRCKVCNGGRARNKDGKPEPLIICGTCRTASHPTCIDLTLAMIDKIESYCWQCMDCKTCAQCNDPDDEERMIFCDMCDRGYHIYCVGLRRVPNGRWHCKECAVCFTCGTKNPSGNEHIKNAEWQHEFKKDKVSKVMKYACTLCMPCDKYWKRRQFCSVCLKVYRSIPEDGMVRCLGCPKYVHKDVCSILHENERYCNYCFKSRNKTALNHSRIIAAAKKKMATGNPLWK